MIAVLDAGSSSVRAVMVDDGGVIRQQASRATPPSTPAPSMVEYDGRVLAAAALECLDEVGAAGASALGITTQRATTFLWEANTGEPVGPGLSWQDLRTVGTCIALSFQGIHLAPNASVTKLSHLLDLAPSGRERAAQGELLFGTLDTWLAWSLTGSHLIDPTEAATTGMFSSDTWDWDPSVLEALSIPDECLPRLVPTSGVATAWGDVPLAAMVGDQQASLVGQGCLAADEAKLTVGTGAMLDVVAGTHAPARADGSWRSADGTYPIIAWEAAGERRFGVEAIMLTAGDAVAWLVDLGLLPSAPAAEEVARSVASTDGVTFVPALSGLGSPRFDFGARGAFTGLTRGSSSAHLVRAVLEGIAHSVADCVEAASVSGVLKVDGGAAANHLLLEEIADLTGLVVARAPVTDATALGAALWAGVAVGTWRSPSVASEMWPPAERIEPSGRDRSSDRSRWSDAVRVAERWLEEFSALPL